MERQISDQAADEAGAWDARLRAHDCTDDDRARFARWRDASPEHREAFERIQTIVATFRSNIGRADVRALRDAALATVRRRRKSHAWIAAAMVAALGLGVAILATLGRGGVYETGIGRKSTITLQDGSSVELNSRTRIAVAYTQATRTVQLLAGQALFHVAKNPQRPFIVRAADRDITAVGTAFDVRLDSDSVRVTLIEGKVRVSKDSYLEPSVGRAESLRSAETSAGTNEIYLMPGQQLVAHQLRDSTVMREATIRTIDISKVTGWRDGRVFLEDLTLAEAVAEMNRYSEVQIRIDDPALAVIRVNGMFRAGEQRAFVAALEQYFPITARHESDVLIALTRQR
jgi:transmembrane sensor